MAITSPDNIRTPDPNDPYQIVADLATTANDVQSALVKRANMYVGTAAQRAAFTTAPEGTHWQDTNSNKSEWVWRSGEWVETLPDTGWLSLGYGSGFGAQSFGNNPQYRVQGGRVYLRGLSLKSSGNIAQNDKPFGNLPAAARPATVTYYITRGTSNTSINGQVNPDGSISCGAPQNGTASWIALDGVSFTRD